MLPFTSSFSVLSLPDTQPTCPVAIGGVTQRKTSFAEQGSNSQDALGAFIGMDFIIGVVSDGCGSGHLETERWGACSSNEVGARLLTQGVLTVCKRMLTEKHWFSRGEVDLNDAFVSRLSNALIKTLKGTVLKFCGDDESLREHFIFNNLMATVLGVIVTSDSCLVFGCGDGYFGINGEIVSLQSESGNYLANALLPVLCPRKFGSKKLEAKLLALRKPNVESLQGVLLATDGFIPIHTRDDRFFTDLLSATPAEGQVELGYDRLIREVRQRLANGTAKDTEFSDDATMIAVRRIRAKQT